MEFKKELQHLINRFSKENGSNTPDFILADHLAACLENFDRTSRAREKWYGKELRIGGDVPKGSFEDQLPGMARDLVADGVNIECSVSVFNALYHEWSAANKKACTFKLSYNKETGLKELTIESTYPIEAPIAKDDPRVDRFGKILEVVHEQSKDGTTVRKVERDEGGAPAETPQRCETCHPDSHQ